MISGLPIVSALKRFRSVDSRHGNALPAPMTPVAGDGGDQGNNRLCHTATGALIAGQGS